MTKSRKARISVVGMQMVHNVEDGEDTIEHIMSGMCRKIGEYHYIRYEELQEGFTQKTDVLLKVKDGYLEMTKKGLINVHMLIASDTTSQTSYQTPFGQMLLQIQGRKIRVTETEEGLYIQAEYSIDLDKERLSDNALSITATYCNA